MGASDERLTSATECLNRPVQLQNVRAAAQQQPVDNCLPYNPHPCGTWSHGWVKNRKPKLGPMSDTSHNMIC